MPIESSNGRDLEWFASLADVPGIEWTPPEDLAVEAPLSTARPVLDVYGDDRLVHITWVAGDGSELPGDSYGSPTERVASTMYEAETVEEIATTVSTALSLPGTKPDYFEVVSGGLSAFWQIQSDPLSQNTQMYLALLAIDLLGTGIRDVVAPPFPFDDEEPSLRAAATPYLALLRIYRSEGFLLEAAKTYEAIQELPQEAREQGRFDADPQQTIDVLADLMDAVDWPK